MLNPSAVALGFTEVEIKQSYANAAYLLCA